eukprot:scpid110969/ scgid20180/ 
MNSRLVRIRSLYRKSSSSTFSSSTSSEESSQGSETPCESTANSDSKVFTAVPPVVEYVPIFAEQSRLKRRRRTRRKPVQYVSHTLTPFGAEGAPLSAMPDV